MNALTKLVVCFVALLVSALSAFSGVILFATLALVVAAGVWLIPKGSQ